MDRRISQKRENTAAAALLLATVFWGCGFTWAKAAGAAVQDAAGMGHDTAFGPVFILAWRFLIAAVVWIVLFPQSRQGWTWPGARRALLVGLLCGAGLVVQHLGLNLTSEAVSAFLTSLTILFVPLLMMFVFRKPPRAVLWLGVALATAGVWLMTGAQPSGFGLGEVLGLFCAVVFSLYILAVNHAVAHDSPWRMTAGQFIVVAAMCFVTCCFLNGRENLAPVRMKMLLSVGQVWVNVALLSVFTTLGAFGILTHFQPRIDPTRAALIYLAEPVFATIYASVAAHHPIGKSSALGAALILIANVLVEVLSARAKGAPPEPVMLVD
jgi:drug/metabolite transporter (DMT)-like permease